LRETVAGDLDLKSLESAMKYFTRKFDPENGGFGAEPKFPTPVNLEFLLQVAALKSEILSKQDISAAEQMVMNTLQKMALGGIHGIIL
jgi:uncharacterized protein YyaL (SSP411 family)